MLISELLCELIKIPSYSAQEGAFTNFIANFCDTRSIPYDVYKNNVVMQFGDRLSKNRLLFNAHMDVVSGENWRNEEIPEQLSAFDPRIKNGKLYGRGAADTKAGLAAMLVLAERLMNENSLAKGTAIDIVFTCAEESQVEENGVRHLCEQGVLNEPVGVVIAEPSNLEVLIGSGGIAQYYFEGPFIKDTQFAYIVKNECALIAELNDSLGAIDRAVIAAARHLQTGDIVPEGIVAGDISSSIRPFEARILGIEELIVCADIKLRGHPAYAEYDNNVYHNLLRLIPHYLPFDLLSAALQIIRYRASWHLENTASEFFAPLPTFEFTAFTQSRFQISCRLSPEISLKELADHFGNFKVSCGLWEDDVRDAVFTSPTEKIVCIAQQVVKEYFGDARCVSIQRGASDAQLLRQYFPKVPFILLSAGSGVLLEKGTIDKAPVYLSTSHQPNEYVDIAQLEKLPEIYLKIVRRFE